MVSRHDEMKITHSVNLVFIIYLPAPPMLTPFPYTTLFRSEHDRVVLRRRRPHERVLAGVGDVDGKSLLDQSTPDQASHLDRESTRLNSSHMSISYGVFCSKEK